MRLTRRRPYGYGHIKQMERKNDVAGLLSALDNSKIESSSNLRAAVMTSLRRIKAQEAAPRVSEILREDSDEMVRGLAAKALGEIGDGDALPFLRAALEDPSKKVQKWVIRSLGQIGDQESVDALVRRLDDSDWGMRAFAAEALGEIGDERAREALERSLGDKKGTVRNTAARALTHIESANAG